MPYFVTNSEIVSWGFTGFINGKYPKIGKPKGPGGSFEWHFISPNIYKMDNRKIVEIQISDKFRSMSVENWKQTKVVIDIHLRYLLRR